MEENKSDLLLRFTEIITGSRKEEKLETDEEQKITIDSIMNSPDVQTEAKKIFIVSGSGKTRAWLDMIRENLKEDGSYSPLKYEEIDIDIIDHIESLDSLNQSRAGSLSGLFLNELIVEESIELEEKAKEPNMRVTTRKFLDRKRHW